MLARSSLALLAVVAATLAGCTTQGSNDDSSGKFQGDQRLVANTIEDLQSAARKGDEGKICSDLLASELATRLRGQGGSCQLAVHAVLEDTDSFDLTVESVRITGTSASAQVKADRGDRDEVVTLGLVKQGQGWRISDLGG